MKNRTTPAEMPAPIKHTTPIGTASDEDLLGLLECADNGDASRREALEEIVRRWQGRLLAFAQTITRERVSAEEAVQDAFIDLWSAVSRKGTHIEHLKAWLFRLVSRKAIKAMQRQRSRTNVERQEESQDFAMSKPSRQAQAVELEELKHALHGLVEALPERLRHPVLLHFVSGFPQAEVAQIVGCTQSTVSERISEGIEKLKQGMARLEFKSMPMALPVLLHEVFASPPHTLLTSMSTNVMDKIGRGGQDLSRRLAAKSATKGLSVLALGTSAAVAVVALSAVLYAASHHTVSDHTPKPIATAEVTEVHEPVPAQPWAAYQDDALTVPDKAKIGNWVPNKLPDGLSVAFSPVPSPASAGPSYCYLGPNRQNSFEMEGVIEFDSPKDETTFGLGICMPNRVNFHGTLWPAKKSYGPLTVRIQVLYTERGCLFTASGRFENGQTLTTKSESWMPAPWTREETPTSSRPGWMRLEDVHACAPAVVTREALTIRSLKMRKLTHENLIHAIDSESVP